MSYDRKSRIAGLLNLIIQGKQQVQLVRVRFGAGHVTAFSSQMTAISASDRGPSRSNG